MLQRPALDAMRDAAIAGQFQVLYVYDRGRLARKFAYQEIVIEELTDHNIQFVTLKDVNAVTPEEHVLQAMQGVFAEYERVKIAERMRRGKLYKARNGVVINGQSPYGYKYVKKTETVPTHFEINPEEAEVVKKIFYWVGVERISLNDVIRRLYDLRVSPRKGKSEFWTKGPILRLLKNEAYAKGLIYYNKSEAVVAKKPLKNDKYKKVKRNSKIVRPRTDWIAYNVTPIIQDNGLYEKVKQVLENNQRSSHALKKQRFNYLLSGLIYCACGSRRAGDGSSKYGHFYYRCIDHMRKPTGIIGECKAHGVNANVLDGMFWHELKRYLTDKDYLRKQAEEWLISEMNLNNLSSHEQEKLVQEIQKLIDEQDRFARAYGAGTLEFDQFKELMRESKKKVEFGESRLRELKVLAEKQTINPEQLDLLCEESERIIKDLKFDDKKRLVGDIIDKVTVHEDGRVETLGHLPIFSQSWDNKPDVTQELGLYATSRNCRTGECGEEYAF